MAWNWQLPDWPKFAYELERISQKERQFLLVKKGALKRTGELRHTRYWLIWAFAE